MVAEPVRDPIAQGAVALSSCNREPQAEAQECTEGVGCQPQTKCLGRAGREPCTGTGFLQNPKVGAASLAISLREQGVSAFHENQYFPVFTWFQHALFWKHSW